MFFVRVVVYQVKEGHILRFESCNEQKFIFQIKQKWRNVVLSYHSYRMDAGSIRNNGWLTFS